MLYQYIRSILPALSFWPKSRLKVWPNRFRLKLFKLQELGFTLGDLAGTFSKWQFRELESWTIEG
jgi:hypothetical protein